MKSRYDRSYFQGVCYYELLCFDFKTNARQLIVAGIVEYLTGGFGGNNGDTHYHNRNHLVDPTTHKIQMLNYSTIKRDDLV